MEGQFTPTNPTTTQGPLEEVMSVRDVFTKAADSIVEASHLKTTTIPGLEASIVALRGDMDKLRADIEAVRQRNQYLDDQVNHARRQRDEAYAETAEVRRELEGTKENLTSITNALGDAREQVTVWSNRAGEAERHLSEVTEDRDRIAKELAEVKDQLATQVRNTDHWQANSNRLDEELREAKRNRDDAELRVMELEEKVESFRSRHEAVQTALSNLTSALGLPNPTPKGEEVHRPLTPSGTVIGGSEAAE